MLFFRQYRELSSNLCFVLFSFVFLRFFLNSNFQLFVAFVAVAVIVIVAVDFLDIPLSFRSETNSRLVTGRRGCAASLYLRKTCPSPTQGSART